MRHNLLVRITHWVNTLAFLALVVSGSAILLAHPRLYWGETGAFGSPALFQLPLRLNLDQSGWGRSLHFLAAWICVLNGVVYVLSGLVRRHFTAAMPATGPDHANARLISRSPLPLVPSIRFSAGTRALSKMISEFGASR